MNGNNCSKSFSDSKYEDPEQEAIAFRRAKIAELNELGANYNDNHGVQY